MLRQQKFLTDVVSKLDSSVSSAPILAELEQLRELVTRRENMRVHLSAHVQTLAGSTDPLQPWTQDFLPSDTKEKQAPSM